MDRNKLVAELDRLLQAANEVMRTRRKTTGTFGPDEVDRVVSQEWGTSVLICFTQAFGPEHHLTLETAKNLTYGSWRAVDFDALLAMVRSARGAVERDVLGAAHGSSVFGEPLVVLDRVFDRFHTVAKPLRERRKDQGKGPAKKPRPTLVVGDEYDVQDLLHALLRIFFDDVRPETWTPNIAGASKRIDLVLWNERIAVETKMTRASLTDSKLVDERIIDIRHYAAHTHCKTLVAFVYDPNEFISNPKAVESDLAQHTGDLKVRRDSRAMTGLARCASARQTHPRCLRSHPYRRRSSSV